MSSHFYDKRLEYEKLVLQSLARRDLDSAFRYLLLAAECANNLAKECSGQIAEAYIKLALQYLKNAKELKEIIDGKTGSENKSGRLTLKDIYGMEDAKQIVQTQIIAPLKDPEGAKKYGLELGGGLLLYGVPGTGKTYFAQAVSGELDLPFFEIRTSEILDKYVGEAPKKMQAVFDEARQHPMSVIFIDEIDDLVQRGGDNATGAVTKQVTNVILEECTNTTKNPFFLIGATNYPDMVDAAFLNRCKGNYIEVELPDAETREFILMREFNKLGIPIDDDVLDYLVKKTDGFACRDVVGLIGIYNKDAYLEQIPRMTKKFCEEHFKDIRLSSKDVVSHITRFKEQIGIAATTDLKKKISKKDSDKSEPVPEEITAPEPAPAPDTPPAPITVSTESQQDPNQARIIVSAQPLDANPAQIQIIVSAAPAPASTLTSTPAPAPEQEAASTPAPAPEQEAASTPAPAPEPSSAPSKKLQMKRKQLKDPNAVTFDDIKGLEKAKEIVNDTLVYPTLAPEIYRQMGVTPGKGMLLYGPPGTGKTMFARAIANELHCEFRLVIIDDIKGKTPMETTTKIKDVFASARRSENGCVLFIDDCEEILSRPGKSKAYGVGQFLTELDGISSKNPGKGNVFVLIATNRPWMIDGALLRAGRISEAVYVGLPNQEARKEIIESAFEDTTLSMDVDIDKLAEKTEGYCCAEIHHKQNGGGICDLARRYAARRWMERISRDPDERFKIEPITWNDLMEAMENITPASIRDRERIQQNEEFRKKMESTPVQKQDTDDDTAKEQEETEEIIAVEAPADESDEKDIVDSSDENVDDDNDTDVTDGDDMDEAVDEEDEEEDDEEEDDETSTPSSNAFNVRLPLIPALKQLVFNSGTVQDKPDYKHIAEQIYFYYNDSHEDRKTYNGLATRVESLKEKYGLTDVGDDPTRPAIVIYEGLNLVNTTVAAAYLTYFPDLELNAPEKLRKFLLAMNHKLCENNSSFGLQQMMELNNIFDIFQHSAEDMVRVEALASAMGAFVIAHELGHIINGDIHKIASEEAGAYARNSERAADQFAAEIFNGLEDTNLRDLFYLGAALSFIADISLGAADAEIEATADNTHPATLERFCNLIKNADADATASLENLMLNRETFEQCII